MADVEIILKKADRTFSPGERIRGVVKITAKSATKHNGIKLLVEGGVTFQYTGSNNMNLFDVVMNSFKPIKLVDFTMDLVPAGKVPEGITEIPFEFILQKTGENANTTSSPTTTTSETDDAKSYKLYSTYHGVYLSVRYKIHVEMKFGFFTRDLKKFMEFIVHNPGQGFQQKHVTLEQEITSGRSDSAEMLSFRKEFDMDPSKLHNVRKSLIGIVPEYHIKGHFDYVDCNVGRAFKGELRVVKSAVNIKSIELQLVRVESCAVADGMVKEATEIQNLQLAEGNVFNDFTIPIFMVFPRLFTCPTLITNNFKVEFEVNLIVLFTDGHQITENIPLRLYSAKEAAAKRTRLF